jgi:hypothetical protein
MITILEVLAVVLASLATLAGILMTWTLLLHVVKPLRQRIPILKVPTVTIPQLPKRKKIEPKKKRRTEDMSKDTTSEGITFNDIFMFMIAVPLVLLWVGFAGFVIHTGLNNSSVLDNIEAYTTLIAILGGPALLIIKDALDVWKQEQAEKTAFYKVKAQAVIDYNDAAQKQAQMIEANDQAHDQTMDKTVTKKK